MTDPQDPEDEIAPRSFSNSYDDAVHDKPATPSYEDFQTWPQDLVDDYYADGGDEP